MKLSIGETSVDLARIMSLSYLFLWVLLMIYIDSGENQITRSKLIGVFSMMYVIIISTIGEILLVFSLIIMSNYKIHNVIFKKLCRSH